jgi:CHAT domain-containing protein/tetratricopeptide repeat protein
MRTITLELLRDGPPHNQLLSPLTPYLALCENHGAVTVQLSFEHNQLLHRLRALSYRLGEEARAFQLKDTAAALGALLAGVPGLTAELSRQSQRAETHTNLRLIVSASELALLPFELALAPNGFPGAGQQLLLQNALPLSLTREVRRVQEEHFRWPKRPKILFVAAAPPGIGEIPLESHLLALRRAVDPWVKYYDETDDESRRRRIAEHITLLPRASITDIETACATGDFTHIHLLAHGIEWKDDYDVRYGVALHDAFDPDGEPDRVSGARLASAIRPVRHGYPQALTCPAVITLASCESANVGSVTGTGASIAHALHEAGIPLVIASQFPLSFEGSVLMVEALYNGLLWGQDPRVLVSDLRRQLHTQFPRYHDWASIVAYASLPSGFEADMVSVKLRRVMAHFNTAMNYADKAVERLRREKPSTAAEAERLVGPARNRMERARARLEQMLKDGAEQHTQILGNLASAEKRQAAVLYAIFVRERSDSDRFESRRLLERARDHYWQSFMLNRGGNWAIVQYLSLDLVIRRWTLLPGAPPPHARGAGTEPTERDPVALWGLAQILSIQDLSSKDATTVEWALGNLIELYVLAPVLTLHDVPTPEAAEAMASNYARELVAKAGADSFTVYSTRNQMLRYVRWYVQEVERHDVALRDVVRLAEIACKILPETANEDWN